MNKKYFAAAALACALMSCGTGKNSVAVVDFTGEWNIVEVNGEKVSAENAPFLGFDKDGHRLYGNAGCNRLMGSFEFGYPECRKSEIWSGGCYSDDVSGYDIGTECTGSIE